MQSFYKMVWLVLVLAGCTFRTASVASPAPGILQEEILEAAVTLPAGGSPSAEATSTSSLPAAEVVATDSTTQVATAVPAQSSTFTPTIAPEMDLVYEDTFTAENSWFTRQGEDFVFAYHEGRYQITVLQLNTAVWSTRQGAVGDVLLEVEAFPETAGERGLFGLICRFVDGRNYYAMLLSTSGEAAIHRYESGTLSVLARLEPAQASPAPAYDPGTPIRLQASCTDSTLSLSVDGQPLLSAQDEAFLIGDVGLAAATGLEGHLVVSFDNFKVYRP